MLPDKPSECIAALSLSEDGAEHPYLSIFYTVNSGTIRFYGLLVKGTEEVEEEKRLLFKHRNESTNDPDKADQLIAGTLYRSGHMHFDERLDVLLENKDDALTFASVLRAMYQMQEEFIANTSKQACDSSS